MAAAFCRCVSWVVSPPWWWSSSSSRLSLHYSAHRPLPLARSYSTSYTKTRRSKSDYSSPGERRKVVIKCLSNESETEAEFELQPRLFSNLNQTTLKREPGSLASAILLVAGTTVGAGILAIPAVTLESGFLASALTCILCWLYMVATGLLIAQVNVNTMCELGSGSVSLVSMAMRTMGSVGVQIVCWSYIFIHYALLVAYVARSSEILTNFLGIPLWESATMFSVLLGGICYFGSQRFIGAVNGVLVSGIIISFAALVAVAGGYLQWDELLKANFQAVPMSIPIIVLSFVYQNVVPVLCTDLEGDLSKVRTAIVLGTSIPLVLFLVWNAVILGTITNVDMSSDKIMDPLQQLQATNEVVGPIVEVFSLFAIATSYIGFVLGLSDFLADLLKLPGGQSRSLPYLMTLAPPVVLSLLDPEIFFKALDFAGTYGVLVLFGIVPAAMSWSDRYSSSSSSVGMKLPQLVPGGRLTLSLVVGAPAPAPAPASDATETKGLKPLISLYSNCLWNRVRRFLPASDSNFLRKIPILAGAGEARSWKRRECLPLPLPFNPLESSGVSTEASRVFDVLHDMLEHIFSNLHNIQKNLQFWQSRAEGSNAQKVKFMVLERGPHAFIEGAIQLIRGCIAEGSSIQSISLSASAHISERITILTSLRCSLATFLAQVYMEIDKFGDGLVRDPENSLPSLLIRINGLFFKLEASVGHVHAMRQVDSSVEGSYSVPLLFEKLPEINQEGSQWTDCEIKDAINLVYQNLYKLDSYLSSIVCKHRKPRKVTQYWIRYTCGAVGLSVCSVWLIGHSSLMGSPDIDNWVREARDSTVSFFSDHVEQPLLSIRDELFETFRKRHKGMMDHEEVQLTSNSLHRMLLAFTEQTKGQKFPENATDQEMLEIVMARYEEELTHPIQNLLNGELARAMLIQVQKLKLDIETAMLELNQILRANEINFAILAALPAFFLSLILLMVVRAWFKQDTRAEGRGRIARIQRRLLVVEVEKQIMQYRTFYGQGMEKEAQCVYGLLLYSLDRLYRAVKRHAKATGEWKWLSEDIVDLGKPSLQIGDKLILTSRMVRVYDCLLPSLKRQ
ncbi:hypothetical protein D8674_021875 [Pyrus ussuriensis x Pyrus communis]|uniref:Uncharacterized protein n=1 Tax=Pyrus ussuriensis x Pyrus communis TaxID=2448454 RepID=A0A5N5GJH7_9ROSA|nr:hypothetical protein D8674_021875 [Pyrus ussuriensis x Pyrus communis]